MSDADSTSAKDLPLTRLHQFRKWSQHRDSLVCDAKRAGATYSEIQTASGLARATVHSILDRAGLTGDHPTPQEDTVTTPALPTDYPHQPNFVHVEPAPPGEYGLTCRYLNEMDSTPPPRVKFTFRPFTGHEPAPVSPTRAGENIAVAMSDEIVWALRVAEWHVADDLWHLARYTQQMLPLLRRAATIWPDYDAACHEIDTLYRDLRTTTANWNQALLLLFDAHEKALDTARDWEDVSHEINDLQVEQKRGNFPSVDKLAQEHGIDSNTLSWRMDRDAYTTVQRVIAEQKRRLDEVAQFTGPETPHDRT